MNIKLVVKNDSNSYFYPLMYYFVVYDDDSYSLYEGDNLQYIAGINNPNIKEQFPKKEDILEYRDCHPKYTNVFINILNAYKDYNRTIAIKIKEKLKIKNDFSNIYFYKQGTEEYNNLIKNMKQALTLFKRKCFLSGIKYEINENKMIKSITQMIDAKVDPRIPSFRNDVSFCYSINAIKKEYEKCVSNIKTIDDIDDIEFRFQKASNALVLYTSEFLGLKDMATIALSSKNPEDKELLKKYTEFLIVLPKYASILSYLNSCVAKLQEMKQNFKNNMFEENPEFLEKIDDIIEHDKNTDTYLYHVAKNEFEANRIINEGLYMYSDRISSATYEEFSRDEVLEYEYGNQFNSYDNYIIVIDKPKDTNITRELSEEEANNAMIVPRRVGLTKKPTHIIDSEYIVGYVDKENMNVVYNQKHKNNAR